MSTATMKKAGTAGKWHISPEIGPAKCSAKIACRYGDQEHYDSQVDAFKAYEQNMNHDVMKSYSRKTLVKMGYFEGKTKAEISRILKSNGRPDGEGTIDDPISLKEFPDKPKGARVKQAVHLLAEGKHIRMSSEKEYATMLYKLHEIMEEEGLVQRDDEGNPIITPFGPKYVPVNIGLCAVKGTNIFCGENIGVPRPKMPQTAGIPQPETPAAQLASERFNSSGEINLADEFQDELKSLNISVEDRVLENSSVLKASQNEIDGAKVRGMVNGIIAKVQKGESPDAVKPSVITKDGYVVDGHHGWASVVMYNRLVDAGTIRTADGSPAPKAKLKVVEIDMEIGATLDFANDFCNRWGIPPSGM